MAFCGCSGVILDEAECPAPADWVRAKTHTVFGLAAGRALPLPPVQEELWAALRWEKSPPAGPVADALFAHQGQARRDDFYSELCTKRSRGQARVWALYQGESLVCTVGAYALWNGQAYMACGQTDAALRGRGIGGRLIVQMANTLAAEGWQPVFLCSPERVPFYTRLGFTRLGEYARYEPPEEC